MASFCVQKLRYPSAIGLVIRALTSAPCSISVLASSIPLVVPFASGYERLWLALGAISLDIMLAMIVTSLLRGRLNRILWRAIHLLAYLSWPVAFAHSIGSSKDLQQGWMLGLAVGCAVIVVAAVIWRLAHAARQVPRAGRVAAVFSQHTVTR